MFSIGHSSAQLCQGLSRRELLRVGGLGGFGLLLPQLLSARAAAANAGGHGFGRAKACIVGFLFGAPAHQDMWDLKPDAPVEVRGEFQPIATSVPGTSICELLPQSARLAHRFALVRSVTHPDNTHTVAMHYMLSGNRHRRPNTNPMNAPDDFPCYGSVIQKLRPSSSPLPSGMSINSPGNEIPSGHIFPGFFAGFLGSNYDPLFVAGDPSEPSYQALPQLRPAERESMQDRERLLDSLDALRRRYDFQESVRDTHRFHEKAVSLLTSPSAGRALDLSREPENRRSRYGRTPFGQGLLLARRLIESDVSLVTVNWSRNYQANTNDLWDTHAGHFTKMKQGLAPAFDAAFSALLEDLDQRGLLDETLVIMLGEFGRTPKINANAGRDHWAGCNTVVMAGGGIRGGLVYGASDRTAAWPTENPVGPEDIAATLYHALGLSPETYVHDRSGRPLPIAPGRVIGELIA